MALNSFVRWLAAIPVLSFAAVTIPCELPKGMVVMAETDGAWLAQRVANAEWQVVPGTDDARDPALSPDGSAMIYFDPAGRLQWHNVNTGQSRMLLSSDTDYSYAQAVFGAGPNEVIAARMPGHRSRDADIVALNVDSGKVIDLVAERSTQLEPKQVGNTLVYSTVHCAATCNGFVQEIWLMQRPQNLAHQLTLNRAHSRDPSIDLANQQVYYSSDLSGSFRIYRQTLSGGKPSLVTDGQGPELWPSVDNKGRLWFVRETINGSSLVCRSKDGREHSAPLPEGATRLRELEITI